MGKFQDLSGMTFGKLHVVERDADYISPKGYHSTAWRCRCACGKYTTVRAIYLNSGAVRSCGCFRREHPSRKTHGQSKTRLYAIWKGMIDRCNNEHSTNYARYGGRGISVSDEWRGNFNAFYEWSVANGYNHHLSIDRIDNNADYTPANCRWATNKTQQNNKGNNHLLTYAGKTMTIAQWADETGISARKIKDRINKCKWDIGRSLSTP